MKPFQTQHRPMAARQENWTSTRVRNQEAGWRPNWRETSEFHITTTDESDLDSSNEEENNPETKVPPEQIEALKLQAQTALKEKKELEEKLAQAMSQLEETKNTRSNIERADGNQPLEPNIVITRARPTERTEPSEQLQHLEYTRGFLNRDRILSSTAGTMTLLANELERDLHLTDLVTEKSTETYYAPPQETKLQFLTPAKRVVRDHKEAIDNEKEKLADIITKIKLLEMSNGSGQFDRDIKLEEEKYQRLKQLYLGHKQELARVEKIAERYQPTLEMPEFKEQPDGYRRQFGTLSMKNIINNVPKFDPDNEHGKFSYTWQAILQFGRLEYFNEEEYKQVLSTVLQGPAQDTYQEMARQGYPLKHMLDTFADLYAPRNTIEEDQKEVDNFTRKAKEPIRTAMRRFSCLVDKIRCLSNPISWPDIKYKMCKSVLKQIITIKTRQFIDYEEAKIKKVGGQFDMKELIELVNDFETSHSEVPTEDFTIVYCEASGEPAQWANDLQLRQKAMRQNKNLQEHTKHLANIIGQATTQVAASFIKGSQPKAKMKDAILHQIKKPQRSASASSYRSTKSGYGDTDTEMTEVESVQTKSVNNNHRADKQDRGRSGYKKSNNQTSQQSGQARSYSKDRPQRTTSNERYRSQSGDKGQRSYSKDKGQRSYSKDKGQRSNSNTRTAEAKVNIEKEDGKIIFKNQAYYNCTCSSLHMLGQECPKSGMPIHIKN